MLYNFNDTKFSKFIKITIFWTSFFLMIFLCFLLFKDEIKPAQKPTTIDIEIKNKINICTPKDEEK